jgi:hypothetical protein
VVKLDPIVIADAAEPAFMTFTTAVEIFNKDTFAPEKFWSAV